MEMATREEMEMAWMRDQLLQSDSGEKMLMTTGENQYLTVIPPTFEEMETNNSMEVNNYMMMDGEYDSYDEPPKFMSSTATQTTGLPTKKIRPVKHPGLILKTPIAYQKDSDLSIIPILKDGMAVCEKCGAIGVKHAFYTKERRYCSLECARRCVPAKPAVSPTEELASLPYFRLIKPRIVIEEESEDSEEMESIDLLEPPQEANFPVSSPSIPPMPPDDPPLPPKRKCAELANTYEWQAQLSEPGFVAAPVICFKHAPLSDNWDNITVGMKVEVENTDCDNFSEDFPDSFWVATVLKIAGYKALLRYEGFGQDERKDFWVSLCSSIVHPVGWCATRGKPLIPPKSIQDKYKDWKQFLVKRLTGARTLPTNFYNKVSESLKSRFRCGLNLEVVDKNRISQVKVATIQKIVGKRLHVTYYDATEDDNGFWCHEDSPLIHPVGWAMEINHNIQAEDEYIERCMRKTPHDDDAGSELFPLLCPQVFDPGNARFLEGMKIEAIDPLNLSAICVATVMRVLKEGYIMIRIDSYDADQSGADWFCYHASSPCVFPAGFCEMNNIPLTPPKGHEEDFDWDSYLRRTGAVAAPLALFNCVDMETPPHSFQVGMRVEAADLMDPRLVCVGTVSRVVGRLLKVHFDGWEDEYDQWLDCDSPDIYPVGWCELVDHKLEGPRTPASNKKIKKKPKRRHKKVKLPVAKKRSPIMPTRASDRILREPAQATKPSYTQEPSKVESPVEAISVPTCEPEMGQEPAGPDQSLPTEQQPSTPSIPQKRTATSYINISNCSGKIIPRLVDSSGSSEPGVLVPSEWNVFDVAQFLRVNDCAAYCDSFSRKKIDGKMLLILTKDEIMDLTCMKVGPSLKIFDLIQQLKIKVNPNQERHKAAFRKRL